MSAGADTKVAQITGVQAINMALMEASTAPQASANGPKRRNYRVGYVPHQSRE